MKELDELYEVYQGDGRWERLFNACPEVDCSNFTELVYSRLK